MDALPWYRSPVFIGAIVSILSQFVVLIGIADQITTEDIAKWVDVTFQVIALGSAGYAAWKRKRSDIQPLTLNKARAESHPATLANKGFPDEPVT